MHKLMLTCPRIGITVFALFLIAGLTACGGEENIDLQSYVNEVKTRQKSRIPPLPKPQTFEVFTYNDMTLRNPFVATVEILAAESSDNGLKPDLWTGSVTCWSNTPSAA